MGLKRKISHVLVIDDDEFLLGIIKKKLEYIGYKVTTSSNVHDAHFKLNVLKPDIIMLDIIMPDMNGIEFMSLINSQFGSAEIPIILMSYLPEKELYNMGYSLGNAQYLAKPFNINSLPLKLQKLNLNAK